MGAPSFRVFAEGGAFPSSVLSLTRIPRPRSCRRTGDDRRRRTRRISNWRCPRNNSRWCAWCSRRITIAARTRRHRLRRRGMLRRLLDRIIDLCRFQNHGLLERHFDRRTHIQEELMTAGKDYQRDDTRQQRRRRPPPPIPVLLALSTLTVIPPTVVPGELLTAWPINKPAPRPASRCCNGSSHPAFAGIE